MASAAEVKTRKTAALINALVERLHPLAPLKTFSAVTRELFKPSEDEDQVLGSAATLGMDLLRLKGEEAVDWFSAMSEVDPVLAKKTLALLLRLGGHLSKREDIAISALEKEDPADRERRIQALRDFVTALQGVAGHYFRGEGRMQLLTRGEESILVNALEMGRTIARVRNQAAKLVAEASLGVVSQRLGHATQDELAGLDRFLGVLEQQISLNSEVMSGERYSLYHMKAWTNGVFRRVDMLASILESCEAMRGGALCSAVYAHTFGGDQVKVGLANRILKKVTAPLEEMVVQVAVTGSPVSDPHAEFFVARGQRLDEDEEFNSNLYSEFVLRKDMVPSFWTGDFANGLVSIASESRVARQLGLDGALRGTNANEEIERALHSTDDDADFGSSSQARLSSFVDLLKKRVNDAIIKALFDDHKLVDHLRLLKRFLLLGQGDMAQYLVELTSRLLSSPVSHVSRMELVSCVEQVCRTCLGEAERNLMEGRADCFLAEDDRSALAWDAFTLDYHVDFPLDLVVNAGSMARYQKAFRFLWRLKRVQFSLEQAWKHHSSTRNIEAEPEVLRTVIHKCNLVRSEMVHFGTTLLSYVMFEVLETSFEQLMCDLEESEHLADIVSAHSKYLDDVLLKALIIDDDNDWEAEDELAAFEAAQGHQKKRPGAPASKSPIFALRTADVTKQEVRGLSSRLNGLFEIVLRFCALQDRLFQRISEERQARALMQRERRSRAREARWAGRRQDDEDDWDTLESEFVGSRGIADEYGAQVDMVTSEFWESLSGFLSALDSSGSENLRFLGFRLDFNRFY